MSLLCVKSSAGVYSVLQSEGIIGAITRVKGRWWWRPLTGQSRGPFATLAAVKKSIERACDTAQVIAQDRGRRGRRGR